MAEQNFPDNRVYVLTSSNPGDLVLDPFAGSATMLIAAHKLGRRWAGIEQREEAILQIDSHLLRLGIDVDERRRPQQTLMPEHQRRRGICQTPALELHCNLRESETNRGETPEP